MRQGTPVNDIKSKREYSSLTVHYIWLTLDIGIILVFPAWMLFCLHLDVKDMQSLLLYPGIWICLLVGLLYLLYVLLYKRRNFLFLGAEGLYIVRWGYAVLIAWDKLKEVRVTSGLRYKYIAFLPWDDVCDPVTGEKFVWQDDSELRIEHSRRAEKCIRRHFQITYVRDYVHIKRDKMQ